MRARWDDRGFDLFKVMRSPKHEKILLASTSPRRKKILGFCNIPFKVIPPRGVEEKQRSGEDPAQLSMRLALEKAISVSRQHPDQLVIGADTIVVFEDEVFGKPVNPMVAKKMLLNLSGRSHQVMTGIALVQKGGKLKRIHVEISKVTFKKISIQLIEAYLKTKEPYDKAGGYDIQGTAGKWIKRIQGDYLNIVGLPINWLFQQID